MNTETLRLLVAKGLSAEDILEIAETLDKPNGRSAAAERQARYRERHKDSVTDDVTRDVTSDVTSDDNNPSLSRPLSPQTPLTPTHTHPDNNTRTRKGALAAKPEEVSAQVWDDFQKLRKRKGAPLTETALTGIRREAEKAGWPLEAALAKCAARGWQGLEADWLAKEVPPGKAAPPSNDFLAHLVAKQNRTEKRQ